MSGDFQQAIGRAVNQSFWEMQGGEGPTPCAPNSGDLQVAYDVLISPEMQAIKAFLLWFSHRHGNEQDMRDVLLHEAKLPASVVDWAMEGQWLS